MIIKIVNNPAKTIKVVNVPLVPLEEPSEVISEFPKQNKGDKYARIAFEFMRKGITVIIISLGFNS